METNPTLGELLRDARVQKGISLRTIAKDLGIAPSYLSDIENDRRVPAEEVLKRAATLLGIDFDQVMAQAGRFGEKAERYFRRQPEAVLLFRKISDKNLDSADLRKLQEKIEKEYGQENT